MNAVKNLSLWQKLRLLGIIYLRKLGLIRLSYFVVVEEDSERVQELVKGQSPLTKIDYDHYESRPYFGGSYRRYTYINYQKTATASGKPIVRIWKEHESGEMIIPPFTIKLESRYVWFFKKDEVSIYTSFLED